MCPRRGIPLWGPAIVDAQYRLTGLKSSSPSVRTCGAEVAGTEVAEGNGEPRENAVEDASTVLERHCCRSLVVASFLRKEIKVFGELTAAVQSPLLSYLDLAPLPTLNPGPALGCSASKDLVKDTLQSCPLSFRIKSRFSLCLGAPRPVPVPTDALFFFF